MTAFQEQLPSVRLRAMEPEDLDILYHIENDPEIWNVGTTNVPYSRYALYEYISSSTGDIYKDRQVRLMIESMENEVVGIIDLVNFDPAHLRAEVGIVIEMKYRGCGYGMAALGELAEYARRVVHLHQLYAVVAQENAESVLLFENAGYRQSLQLKDWLYDGSKYNDAIVMQFFL